MLTHIALLFTYRLTIGAPGTTNPINWFDQSYGSSMEGSLCISYEFCVVILAVVEKPLKLWKSHFMITFLLHFTSAG